MDFIDIVPRETAGSLTSGKYDFQKDLSIYMLLEYHDKLNDYLFVFDYHDDLVLLDSESSPTTYSFFQIKTRSRGTFTLKSILKRKITSSGEKSNSILGKLYSHKVDFGGKVKELSIISNAPYTVSSVKKGKTITHTKDVQLKKLCKKDCDLIVKNLREELDGIEISNDFFSISFFRITNLSTTDSSTHVKGVLSKFLNDKGINKYNPELIYDVIFNEVKRKTSYSKIISSFEELKEKKGIGKSFFDKILQTIGEKKDFARIWSDISISLTDSGLKYGEITKYKDVWKKLEVDRMNPTNAVLHKCIKEIQNTIKQYKATADFADKSLLEMSNEILGDFIKTNSKFPFEKNYLMTIIFCELHG